MAAADAKALERCLGGSNIFVDGDLEASQRAPARAELVVLKPE